MTHKAYNGRIIVAYFAECCDLVVSKNLPGDSRLFGQWLTQQVIQGKRDWPTDTEFGLASTCLLLSWFFIGQCSCFFVIFIVHFCPLHPNPTSPLQGSRNQPIKEVHRSVVQFD